MRASPRLRAILVSCAALAPCWWRERIQAGDLSSHIYNAWLAGLINRGEAPGLAIAHQNTNVLFDWILACLFPLIGPAGAQRVAVSIAVLVFFWGVFAGVRALSRRAAGDAPWFLAPVLLMLAYGWVFRMGFFNFYLSFGMSCGALALGLRRGRRWKAAALALLLVALVAHALPVAWIVAQLAYISVAVRLRARYRFALTAASLGALLALRWCLVTRYGTEWFPEQALSVSGLDQLWIYGFKYYAVVVFSLALALLLVRYAVRRKGGRRLLLGIPFHLGMITAAGVAFLPTAIQLPGYHHPLNFVAPRMSLAAAVLGCAMLASCRPPRWAAPAFSAAAMLFFSFAYVDEGGLNRVEDAIEGALAQVPPNSRVVSAVRLPGSRIRALDHMIDRACIGRCYSYANYEPPSAAFRVRVTGPNPIVVASPADSFALQDGSYIWKQRDLPVYRISLCADSAEQLCAAPGEVGIEAGAAALRAIPAWWTQPSGSRSPAPATRLGEPAADKDSKRREARTSS